MILNIPQEVVLPVPDTGSFILSYLIFGTYIVVVDHINPLEPAKEYPLSHRVLGDFLLLTMWPLFVPLINYHMEKKLKEENLFEELLKDI